MRSLPMILTVCLAALWSASTALGAPPGKDSAVPQDYIIGFAKRGVDCAKWRGRTWASWQTYASGRSGDRWVSVASARGLCGTAQATGRRAVAPRAAAGLRFPEALAAASNGRVVKLDNAAPAGWRCFRLPTQWSLSAYAQAEDPSGELDAAYAATNGLAAPFGFCVSGARRSGKRWAGGRFFSFGPDAGDCLVRLKLLGTPDPAGQGADTFPSYSEVSSNANKTLASFYDQDPC